MKVLFGVLCALCLIHGASAQTNQISNPSDLVGMDFSDGLAARLPYMDCTTPENTFLGYFRAGINGSMREHLFYMTTGLKESLLEGREEEDISDDENLLMTTVLQESEYNRVYVASLDWQPTVAPTQFLASVCSVFEGTRVVESWTIGLVYTNGVWKVNRDEIELAGRYPIGNRGTRQEPICDVHGAFLCPDGISSVGITNVEQCVNTELSPGFLDQVPSCDNSTHHTCLLGFIKGAATGDFRTFLWPLSNEMRIEEAGISDLSLLTTAMTNQFLEFVSDSGFSNHFVCAYSEIQTNGAVHATISVRSRSGLLVKTNDVKTILQTSNGLWRIVEWDVDE